MKKKQEGTQSKVVGYIPRANHQERVYKQSATVIKINSSTISHEGKRNEKQRYFRSVRTFLIAFLFTLICLLTITLWTFYSR